MLIRHATGNLVELFENIHKTWPATYSATFGICFLFGDGVLNVHTVQLTPGTKETKNLFKISKIFSISELHSGTEGS